ncbi:MAG: DNA primase, partial [Calditerrivibrio sp.]|nr:DNA primase [Calditerrivibrio sp.]
MDLAEKLTLDEHLKMADDAEKKGDIKKLITHLNIALTLTSDRKPILERLLEYYLNDSNPNRPLKILNELMKLEPTNPVYYKHAIGILLEMDRGDLALKLAENAKKFSDDDFFKNIFIEKRDDVLIDKRFSDMTITLMFSLFAGREGVYARQWRNNEGQVGYIPVKEPLSEKVIKNHLNGNYTIGIYQHRLDSTVNWLCFDIDIAKHLLNQALANDDKFKELDYHCQKVAREIYDECAKFNIDALIENSGYKGRHVWIFFSNPVAARMVKKMGEVILLNLKISTPDIHIEIFPKQNFVRVDSVGNLVKLPLGIHLASGRRSFFVDKNGREIDNVDELLKKIERINENKILEYLNYYRISEVYEKYSDGSKPEKNPKPSEKVSFPAIGTNYMLEKDTKFQYLLYKCPVLKEIYSNALKKNELTYDEMIVIAHTIGHLETGVDAVNAIFSKCYNITTDKFLKSTLKGNPISCVKIRAKLSEITSSVVCNCKFEIPSGLYPTPLLHLNSIEVDTRLPKYIEINSLNFQNVLDGYISIKKQLYEMSKLLKEYEIKFETIFKESGVDVLDTPSGKFRRVVDEHG